MIALRPTCDCTSVAMLRLGSITCASCGAVVAIASEVDAEIFSTEVGCWPPGARSRRHARELIRRVGEHERVGFGRETQWQVSAESYRRHYRRKSSTLGLVPKSEAAAASRVDGWISAAGFRQTKGKSK